MADNANAFDSAADARMANGELLDRLEGLDPDKLPADFVSEIEQFRRRAAATGALLSSVDDRSELQTSINFWTTMLFSSAGRPASVVLARFDKEAARLRAGRTIPYKGLDPFQAEDHDRFFGRNRSIAEMVDRLADHRLLAVLGLSGSGKSSIVRAGLIPQLRKDAAAGKAGWLVLGPVMPGRRPLEALAQIVEQAAPGSDFQPDPEAFVARLDQSGRRALIIVDQFEELFTLEPEEEEKRRFLDLLSAAATTGARAHAVVLTMRSEYDGRFRRYEAFDALFQAGRVQIPALSARELHSAIVQPAEQLGVSFEAGLAEELVQAVVGEPAGLPLLQFTLLELWKTRSDQNLLTWSAYKSLGDNPREILARRADKVYGQFNLQEDREISRRIFVALVQLGVGLEPMSRRVLRQELDDAVGRGRDNVDRVLDVWRSNGLIRISTPGFIAPDSQIEVAHEALIRNWKPLLDWIEDAFATARRRRLLGEKALAWAQGKGELLGELSLKEAETYDSISDEEREYLDASEAELERARARLRRRNWIALAGSVVLALLALTAGWASVEAWEARLALAEESDFAKKQENEAKMAATAARAAQRRAKAATDASLASKALADRRVREADERLAKADRQLILANRQLVTVRKQEATMRIQLAEARARAEQVFQDTGIAEDRLQELIDARSLAERRLRLVAEEVRLAEAGRASAEQLKEAAQGAGQYVLAALARKEVQVSTAVPQEPAGTRALAARLPVDRAGRAGRAPLGLPEAPLIVDRRIYTVGFDPTILSPRWVAFTIDTVRTMQLRRLPNIRWAFDPEIPRDWQTGDEVYRNNSYDRGHLIRRADALIGPSEADARASEAEIHYFSVTVPQADQTNRTTWAAVEQYATELSARLGPVHVVAGPVYPDMTDKEAAYLTLGTSGKAVPLYLYRVLLRRDSSGRWRSLAFLVPNDFTASRNALQFVTSVSQIEELTGLRFFPELPASEAQAVKANVLPAVFEGTAAD